MARPFYAVWLVLWFCASHAFAQGLALNGIGPVNQSMGGAAVASPIDVVGAIHWNPATLSGLKHAETAFGATLALPSERLSSRTTVPVALAGSTRGEPGVSPIPYAAFADQCDGSRFSYGLGVFGVGGFRANYPASQTNPLLTPQPPHGLGVGSVSGEAEILQIVPTLSYALTDKVSLGFAPTVSLGRVSANPLLLATPDDANNDTISTFPRVSGNRYQWGGGFQLGAYYITDAHWHYGASFKSPQWFERFQFNTTDELGRPRKVALELEYPMIVSLGTAYSGFENILLAADVRHFAYGEAAGLGSSGFKADGSLAGLGWDNVFALAAGMQIRMTDACYFRIGYSFNENPISDAQTSANVASPVITKHFLNVGTSWCVREHVIFSLAYSHGFENEISGPIQTPTGPLPGSQLTSEASVNGLTMGITLRH